MKTPLMHSRDKNDVVYGVECFAKVKHKVNHKKGCIVSSLSILSNRDYSFADTVINFQREIDIGTSSNYRTYIVRFLHGS